MIRYIPIFLALLFSSNSHASWNEHFIEYTCLPEIGLFQLERLSVESPNNLYDKDGVKLVVIGALKRRGIYSISAGDHDYSCSVNDQNITVYFTSNSHSRAGGVVSIKLGSKYLTKNLEFFHGIQSLSKLKINFNGLSPVVSYWSDVDSENDILGYDQRDLVLPTDYLIMRKDLVRKHQESLQ